MFGQRLSKTLPSFAFASLITVMASGTAGASTVTFTFTNSGSIGSDGAGTNDGNQRVLPDGGNTMTVTATAWHLYQGTFYDAALGLWQQGLGVCNDNEGSPVSNCESPNHQVDNEGTSGSKDYVLFQFSTPVSFMAGDYVKITTTDSSDLDVSWWSAATALPASLLSGKTLANLTSNGVGGLNFGPINNNDGSGSTRNVPLLTGNITALLFGARYDGSNDSFKIGGMQVDPPSSPVPEPTSMVLLGTGLLFGAGKLRRKKTSDVA